MKKKNKVLKNSEIENDLKNLSTERQSKTSHSKIKCALYNLLFRFVPVVPFQAWLLDRHFDGCPFCGERMFPDSQKGESSRPFVSPVSTVSLRNAERLPSLWPLIRPELEKTESEEAKGKVSEKDRPVFRLKGWAIAGVAAASVLVVLALLNLLLPTVPDSGSDSVQETPIASLAGNNENNEQRNEQPDAGQVIVQSVKIRSKSAKYYIVKSSDPDKLIVWTQPDKTL